MLINKIKIKKKFFFGKPYKVVYYHSNYAGVSKEHERILNSEEINKPISYFEKEASLLNSENKQLDGKTIKNWGEIF